MVVSDPSEYHPTDWAHKSKLEQIFHDDLGMDTTRIKPLEEWDAPSPGLPISPLDWNSTTRLLVFGLFVQTCVVVLAAVLDIATKNKRSKFLSQLIPKSQFKVEFVFDVLQMVFSTVSCVLWVIHSYDWEYHESLQVVEMALTSYYALHYCCRMACAAYRTKWVWEPMSIMDVFAVSSALSTPFLGGWLPFTFMRAIHVAVSLEHIFAVVNFSQFTERVATMITQLVCIVYVFAAGMYMLEMLGQPDFLGNDADDQNFSFFRACYFIMVTISTVGYGDFSPTNTLSRFVTMLMIIFGVVFFGISTGGLVELMRLRTAGLGRFSSKGRKHIVIAGDVAPSTVKRFLQEMYHPDHEGTLLYKCRVCILSEPEYQPEMAAMVARSEELSRLVEVLQGDCLDEDTLDRCHANTATAIFVMAESRSIDPHGDDSRNILRTLAFKEYIPSGIPVYVHIYERENIDLVKQEVEDAICVTEMKMGIIFRSCLCPGFSTLVSNLILSTGADEDDAAAGPDPPKWLQDYHLGMSHEIYDCDVPKHLWRQPVGGIIKQLFVQRGVLLIALQADRDDKVVHIHPGSLALVPAKAVAYFISKENLNSSVFSCIDVDELSAPSTTLPSLKVANGSNVAPSPLHDDAGSAPASEPRRRGLQALPLPGSNRVVPTGSPARDGSGSGGDGQGKYSFVPNSHLTAHLNRMTTANGGPQTVSHESSPSGPQVYLKGTGTRGGKMPPLIPLTGANESLLDKLVPPVGMPLRGHILLLGLPGGIRMFIEGLRQSGERPVRAVICINEVAPDDDLLEFFASHHQVYFVQGQPSSTRLLLMYDIKHASRVVAMPNNSTSHHKSAMDDAPVIFASRWLQASSDAQIDGHPPPAVIELVHSANVKYVSLAQGTDNDVFESTPLYASGTVLQSSFSTVMLCQSFYNPHAVNIVRTMIYGSSTHGSNEQKSEFLPRPIVAKQVDPPGWVMATGTKVPYKEVFVALLFQMDLMPIGLYKAPNPELGNSQPFVYTNPGPNVSVCPGDKVFVLAPVATT